MAPDVDVCGICDDNFIVSSKTVKCSSCKMKFHNSCVSVKDSWIKIFSECENILWFCNDCKSSMQSESKESKLELSLMKKESECLNRELDLTKKLLADLEYTVQLQKNLLKSYEGNVKPQDSIIGNVTAQQTRLSYSDAAKQKIHSSVLLVRSAGASTSDADKILEDIKSSVNPGSSNICVNTTRKIRNGVAVHCKDDASLMALKNGLTDKLSSKYAISEAKKFNPRLIVKNVKLDGMNGPEDIISDIAKLNHLNDTQKSEIKFVTKLKYKSNTDIVIEVSPQLRKTMLQMESLFIGWKRSPVFDHLRIVKCLKCCSFGHLENECKSDLTCPRCTRKHKLKECKSEALQCINCLNHNQTHKKSLPTDHSANFPRCPVYEGYVDNLQQRIDYG
nr:unnamed protein product [Callosobruchus chinensis]